MLRNRLRIRLKANRYVGEAAVVGDKRRFPSVLIVPNFPMLEEWAAAKGISTASRKELVRSPQVQALYKDIVDELNENLAQYEKLKKVTGPAGRTQHCRRDFDAEHEAAAAASRTALPQTDRRLVRGRASACQERTPGGARQKVAAAAIHLPRALHSMGSTAIVGSR